MEIKKNIKMLVEYKNKCVACRWLKEMVVGKTQKHKTRRERIVEKWGFVNLKTNSQCKKPKAKTCTRKNQLVF